MLNISQHTCWNLWVTGLADTTVSRGVLRIQPQSHGWRCTRICVEIVQKPAGNASIGEYIGYPSHDMKLPDFQPLLDWFVTSSLGWYFWLWINSNTSHQPCRLRKQPRDCTRAQKNHHEKLTIIPADRFCLTLPNLMNRMSMFEYSWMSSFQLTNDLLKFAPNKRFWSHLKLP